MDLGIGESPPTGQEASEELWRNPPAMDEMLSRFRAVRMEEINLLPEFEPSAWESIRRTTFWGEVSLVWMVGKTYQHTLEHTHDLLRFSPFWERVLKRM